MPGNCYDKKTAAYDRESCAHEIQNDSIPMPGYHPLLEKMILSWSNMSSLPAMRCPGVAFHGNPEDGFFYSIVEQEGNHLLYHFAAKAEGIADAQQAIQTLEVLASDLKRLYASTEGSACSDPGIYVNHKKIN